MSFNLTVGLIGCVYVKGLGILFLFVCFSFSFCFSSLFGGSSLRCCWEPSSMSAVVGSGGFLPEEGAQEWEDSHKQWESVNRGESDMS